MVDGNVYQSVKRIMKTIRQNKKEEVQRRTNEDLHAANLAKHELLQPSTSSFPSRLTSSRGCKPPLQKRHFHISQFLLSLSSLNFYLSSLFLRFIFRFTEFLDSTIINHPTVIVESIKKLLCEVLSTGKKVLFCKMKFYKENATIKRIYITYKIALLWYSIIFRYYDLYCVCRCPLKLRVAAFLLKWRTNIFLLPNAGT